jgi:hypothetical protein
LALALWASGLFRAEGPLSRTSWVLGAAIIQWRTDLTVLARRAALDLPADLQAAGRGEIAPSPGGS